MDIKVYTGSGYNAFTSETRTSYVMVDAATGAIVQTCACNKKTSRDTLALNAQFRRWNIQKLIQRWCTQIRVLRQMKSTVKSRSMGSLSAIFSAV